ncbi:LacI family DNA-binding transcriptional regulator [Streptomyces xiamenensis]|uniref:LacI family DNA-binding transcriptional regulator n=1 Tax=Streptomyces xiamenensis TaxID=408015 RepID=UPI003D761A1C
MPGELNVGAGERGRRPATIYDVARLAGVSHMTVSRYLRGTTGVGAESGRKVARAVALLDYRPNRMARIMRTRRSDRIAVILPDATGMMPTRLLTGAARAAHEAGYLLDLVALEGDAAARAERIHTLLRPEYVAGIVAFTPLHAWTGDRAPTEIAVPVVVDGEYDDNMRAQGVLADATPAAGIVRHLAGLGHRRFLHVAGPQAWASARNRRAVYEATVAELGLESYGVAPGDWGAEAGRQAAGRLPGSGVTAVFAANDRTAFGMVQGLRELGIDVPGQVSVFGWDDDEIGRCLVPALSTVRVDRERQGGDAVRRLLALLNGQEPAAPPQAGALNQLVVRDSTGPAPTRAV